MEKKSKPVEKYTTDYYRRVEQLEREQKDQENKEMSTKKSKPVKKYTEEEQLERGREDQAVIVGAGKSDLAGWVNAIKESGKQADDERKEWQILIGEPDQVITIDECKHGFWRNPIGVMVAKIDKRGPNPMTKLFYSVEFIEKLVATIA